VTFGRKLAMGLAAGLPVVGLLGVSAFVAAGMRNMRRTDFGLLPLQVRAPGLDDNEWLGVGIAIVMIALLQMAVAVLFFLHVLGETRLATTTKVLWGLGLLFLGELLLPVYWILYVYRDPPKHDHHELRARLDARYPVDR